MTGNQRFIEIISILEPLPYTSQILRPQSQLCQPQSVVSPSKVLPSPSKYLPYSPSRRIASPSRQIASPSRQIASPSRQIASPPRQIASPSRIAQQYQESKIIGQSVCPSIYSPTKSRVQQQQCGIPQSSYFVQNMPEMNSYVPDYATYLTQSPRGSKHIEQPIQDHPVFVAQQPAQSSFTPGEPVRFDHYQTVGDAPSRIMPTGSPDRTIKARLLQPKSYQQQQQQYY